MEDYIRCHFCKRFSDCIGKHDLEECEDFDYNYSYEPTDYEFEYAKELINEYN